MVGMKRITSDRRGRSQQHKRRGERDAIRVSRRENLREKLAAPTGQRGRPRMEGDGPEGCRFLKVLDNAWDEAIRKQGGEYKTQLNPALASLDQVLDYWDPEGEEKNGVKWRSEGYVRNDYLFGEEGEDNSGINDDVSGQRGGLCIIAFLKDNCPLSK